MNYYEVTFFKKTYDKDRDKTELMRLGKTEISDFGVLPGGLSLPAKAFRHAPASCNGADHLKFECLRK